MGQDETNLSPDGKGGVLISSLPFEVWARVPNKYDPTKKWLA